MKKDENINTIKEELSYAALHALVSHADGACMRSDRKSDNFGIDATCDFRGPFSDNPNTLRFVSIKVQLKGSSTCQTKQNENGDVYWCFPLKYEQLKRYIEIPNLLLCLFIYPPDEEWKNWLDVNQERVKLKKCMYWTSLNGVLKDKEEANRTSGQKTVYIPQRNLLTPASLLNNIVRPIAERKELRYEGL